jgi:outer membrane protein OmpA-like peptidoglycan-associated protein
MINKKFAIFALLASLIFSGAARADNIKDVVVNEEGVPVISTSGECVRTMWDSPSDKCAAPVVQAQSPYVQPRQERTLSTKSRSYLMFFDFDKSNLTADAKEILSTLRSDAKNRNSGATKFDVTGHADRSGSDDYNMRLSNRRAEAVKKQLMSLGVAEEDIATQAKGESDPLVPTEDGVREPQNRRVEVVFGYRE